MVACVRVCASFDDIKKEHGEEGEVKAAPDARHGGANSGAYSQLLQL